MLPRRWSGFGRRAGPANRATQVAASRHRPRTSALGGLAAAVAAVSAVDMMAAGITATAAAVARVPWTRLGPASVSETRGAGFVSALSRRAFRSAASSAASAAVPASARPSQLRLVGRTSGLRLSAAGARAAAARRSASSLSAVAPPEAAASQRRPDTPTKKRQRLEARAAEVERLVAQRRLDEALELLESDRVWLSLRWVAEALAEAGRTADAIALVERCAREKATPAHVRMAWWQIVTALTERGGAREAAETADAMLSALRHLDASRLVHLAAVNAHARLAEESRDEAALERARALLEEAAAASVAVDATYLAVVGALMAFARHEEAIGLLARAPAPMHFRPVNRALHACAERRDWRGGYAVWQAARRSGCEPNLRLYARLLSLCLACEEEAVRELGPELRERGLPEDADGLARLVRALAERDGVGSGVDAGFFCTAVEFSVAAGRHEAARRWADEARAAGDRALDGYILLLRFALQNRSEEQVRRVLSAMAFDDFAASQDPSDRFLEELAARSEYTKSQPPLADAAEALFFVGRFEDALRLLRAARDRGCVLRPAPFATLLSRLAARKQWKSGRTLWSMTEALQVPRTPRTFDAFLALCLACQKEALVDLADALAAGSYSADAAGLAAYVADLERREGAPDAGAEYPASPLAPPPPPPPEEPEDGGGSERASPPPRKPLSPVERAAAELLAPRRPKAAEQPAEQSERRSPRRAAPPSPSPPPVESASAAAAAAPEPPPPPPPPLPSARAEQAGPGPPPRSQLPSSASASGSGSGSTRRYALSLDPQPPPPQPQPRTAPAVPPPTATSVVFGRRAKAAKAEAETPPAAAAAAAAATTTPAVPLERLLEQGRLDEAASAVEAARAWGDLRPVAEALAASGRLKQAVAVLKRSLRAGAPADAVTPAWCHAVIAGKTAGGGAREAAAAADAMLKALRPLRASRALAYASAVEAHSQLAQEANDAAALERAGALMEEASAAGAASDSLFVALACALAAHGKPEEAGIVMRRAPAPVHARPVVRALHACAERRDWRGGYVIWRAARRSGCEPNPRIFTALASLCLACEEEAARDLGTELSKRGLPADADGLVELMRAWAEDAGSTLDATFYGTVIVHMVAAGRRKAAKRWAEEARAAGARALEGFAFSLRYALENRSEEQVRRVLSAMESRGFAVSPAPSVPLVKEIARMDNTKPYSHLADLAEALLFAGRGADAFALLRAALNAGVLLRPVPFAALLARLAARKQWKSGRTLWSMAEELRVPRTQKTFDAFLALCLACREEALVDLAGVLAAESLPADAAGLVAYVAGLERREGVPDSKAWAGPRAAREPKAAAAESVAAPPTAAQAPARAPEAQPAPSRAARERAAAPELPPYISWRDAPPEDNGSSDFGAADGLADRLAASARDGDAEAVRRALEELRRDGLGLVLRPALSARLARELMSADRPARNALVIAMSDSLLLAHGLKAALTFLRACSRERLRPDGYVIGGLVSSAAKRRDWPAGCAFWDLADELGTHRTPFAFQSYLRLCLACEEEAVRELGPELRVRGLPEDANGLARRVLDACDAARVRFDTISFGFVIDHLASSDRVAAAREWIAEARAAGEVDLGTYLKPLRAAIATRDLDEIRGLLEMMEEDGLGIGPASSLRTVEGRGGAGRAAF
eukprot:tig00020951_g16446.t1